MRKADQISAVCRMFSFATIAILLSQACLADSDDGEALFEKRCHKCHAQPDPASPPPEGWATKLDKMAVFARLKDQQKADVLAYLQLHSKDQSIQDVIADDRKLVEQKCSVCHSLGRIALENFDGDVGKHILERMQSYAGTSDITDDELIRILNYLQKDNDLPKPQRVAMSDPEELLTTRCSACHSLERVYALLRSTDNASADWAHVIARMSSKAPDWISKEESDRLADYIRSLSASSD